MKQLFLYMGLAFFYIACNDEKKYSNEKADARDHNMESKTETGDPGTVTNSTASTSNNNAYNTDSASGQGIGLIQVITRVNRLPGLLV